MSNPSTVEHNVSRFQQARHGLALAVRALAVVIAAVAIFRAGVLWSTRNFARLEEYMSPHGPLHPFLASFPRYVIAVLWPIPGAVMLFVAGGKLQGGRRWPWILLLAGVAWLAAYWLVRPPAVYYYWLKPQR